MTDLRPSWVWHPHEIRLWMTEAGALDGPETLTAGAVEHFHSRGNEVHWHMYQGDSRSTDSLKDSRIQEQEAT